MEEFYKKCFEELTPIEKINQYWFKREDKFEPFEQGGVNGSKLRQLIYLVKTSLEKGMMGILAGAVSASPQHPMVARVSKHLNIPCTLLVGTKDIDKFPMLALAKKYNANFHLTNIGYAKALQSKAFTLKKEEKYKNYFVLETNITLSEKLNTPEAIRKFHEIGANQVKNIPKEIENLVIPCGSCNSAVSVLYGLYLNQIKSIKKIYLLGIGSFGSSNINYIFKRLEYFSPGSTRIFSKINELEEEKISIIYYNLNGEGYCKYADKVHYKIDSIEFHPTYEGKTMKYVFDKGIIDDYEHTLFWIIGSMPKI